MLNLALGWAVGCFVGIVGTLYVVEAIFGRQS